VDTLECMGTVIKVMGNNNYSVEIGEQEDQKREILCHLGGKMRRFKINIIPGDEVTLEIPPPFDKGRITFRGKKTDHADRMAKKKAGRHKKGQRR
jgi:translation initiation factor IF-1